MTVTPFSLGKMWPLGNLRAISCKQTLSTGQKVTMRKSVIFMQIFLYCKQNIIFMLNALNRDRCKNG